MEIDTSVNDGAAAVHQMTSWCRRLALILLHVHITAFLEVMQGYKPWTMCQVHGFDIDKNVFK